MPRPVAPCPPAAVVDAEADARALRDDALASLLADAAAGAGHAFASFRRQTFPYAQALARRLLHAADQEDVLASAYFQAWRELGRYDALRGSPLTWLMNIVRSRALDHLRQVRAVDVIPLDAWNDDDAATDAPGPHDLLDSARSDERLHAALVRLSAQERWVLGLAYFRDLSHSRIALATGLPLGTVKSVILRAQAKLRLRLGDR